MFSRKIKTFVPVFDVMINVFKEVKHDADAVCVNRYFKYNRLFTSLNNLYIDLIKDLIAIMPTEFVDLLIKDSLFSFKETLEFILSVMLTLKLNNSTLTDKLELAIKTYFNNIIYVILDYIKNEQLFTDRYKKVKQEKEVYYESFLNIIKLSALQNKYINFFNSFIATTRLEEKNVKTGLAEVVITNAIIRDDNIVFISIFKFI